MMIAGISENSIMIEGLKKEADSQRGGFSECSEDGQTPC
jgi:hypothetical protein